MEVNTEDEEGGSKKVKLTLSHDNEQFGFLLFNVFQLGDEEL